MANLLLILLSVLIPMHAILCLDITPIMNFTCLGMFLVLTFKLISYIHVMEHLKRVIDQVRNGEEEIVCPELISKSNLAEVITH